MPIPDFHLSISGSLLALYGAVLSTITATAQIIAHMRDRAKITVTVRPNMRIYGDPHSEGMTFTMVYVTNAGRRTATIVSIGAHCLHPDDPFVVAHSSPEAPCELTEGKQMVAKLEESALLDLGTIERWEALDTTGRRYKLLVAPWYKRWLSHLRRRIEFRRRRKEYRQIQ